MLKIAKVSDTEYQLLERVTVKSLNKSITVIEGLVFDGASIPKIFWNIVGSPFTGKYTIAALIHDALYMSEALKRKECDEIFLDLMKQYGVSYWKRYSMYWAVRAGGSFVWKKHKAKNVESSKGYVHVEIF